MGIYNVIYKKGKRFFAGSLDMNFAPAVVVVMNRQRPPVQIIWATSYKRSVKINTRRKRKKIWATSYKTFFEFCWTQGLAQWQVDCEQLENDYEIIKEYLNCDQLWIGDEK